MGLTEGDRRIEDVGGELGRGDSALRVLSLRDSQILMYLDTTGWSACQGLLLVPFNFSPVPHSVLCSGNTIISMQALSCDVMLSPFANHWMQAVSRHCSRCGSGE
jgi:hypothetical protein